MIILILVRIMETETTVLKIVCSVDSKTIVCTLIRIVETKTVVLTLDHIVDFETIVHSIPIVESKMNIFPILIVQGFLNSILNWCKTVEVVPLYNFESSHKGQVSLLLFG